MPETTKQPDREIGAEEDFGALFERSLKQPKQGEVVTGRVVLVGRDAGRAHSPLRPAADAVVLDTTALTLEEVVEAMERVVRERGGT